MKKVLYDVEVYPNCFLCGIEDFETGKKIVWEISERKNDFNKVKSFFTSFNKFLISFNGIHYDNPIILWILHNGGKGETKDFLTDLKAWSDFVIKNDFWWNDKSLSKYKYHNQWTDVDLFLHWSKMLRLSKKISLKGLGIQMGYPVVQELPYHPSTKLKNHEIDELIKYNSIHDLGILRLLLEKQESEVQLRSYIQNTYGIKCMSMDAPKIASEVLLYDYCKIEGKDIKSTRKLRFEDNTRLPLPHVDFKLDCFKKLYQEMTVATRKFKKTVALVKNNTAIKISYGIGGIHSVNKNEIYKEDEENLVYTSDVASLYPNLIINYVAIRFPSVLKKYAEVKDDRIEAKAKGIKTKDALLKLILNATSGLIDNKYSWLYYPEGAMKMRLMGQLIMTKTVEDLVIADFQVLSVNTDGVEVVVPKVREEEYLKIIESVGDYFNLLFESEKYKQILYQNVNSYIAETYSTKSPVKQKGFFVEKPKLSDGIDFLVLPKALNAYFLHSIEPEEFIRNHKEIYDFCASKKVDKSYEVKWTTPEGNTSKQQRLNRFYASTKGGYLMKTRDGSENHLLKSSGVMIYNTKTEKFPDDINYQFYINKCKKIITELYNLNQLKLF